MRKKKIGRKYKQSKKYKEEERGEYREELGNGKG